jgi:hypothetical protein
LLNLLSGVFAFGFLPRVRLSKVVGILALCLAAWALAYVFPLELALLMAGDWALYFEVLAAFAIISTNSHARGAIRTLAAVTRRAVRRATGLVRAAARPGVNAFARSRRRRQKPNRSGISPDKDAWGVLAFA